MLGSKRSAHAEEHASQRHHRQRDRHGEREDMAVVDAHQARRVGVVGGRPEGGAQRRAVEQQLQAGDHRDGAGEDDHREHADRQPLDDLQTCRLERAGGQLLAVRRKDFQERVLDDDRQAEGDEQRRQDIRPQGEVEQAALERVADGEHQRHDDRQRDQRMHANAGDDGEAEEARQHDQVAMGDVDQPHDAEDERQAGGEQRVEPADQDALYDGVDPIHQSAPLSPK